MNLYIFFLPFKHSLEKFLIPFPKGVFFFFFFPFRISNIHESLLDAKIRRFAAGKISRSISAGSVISITGNRTVIELIIELLIAEHTIAHMQLIVH